MKTKLFKKLPRLFAFAFITAFIILPIGCGELIPEEASQVSIGSLPQEALDTLQMVKEGGPFPFQQDGTTFHNFEGLLPEKPAGYYLEYTVITTGSPNRGARRIVSGKGGEYYYTDDHYASFKLILE